MLQRALPFVLIGLCLAAQNAEGQIFRGRGNNYQNRYQNYQPVPPQNQQQGLPQGSVPGSTSAVQGSTAIVNGQTVSQPVAPKLHWSQQLVEGVTKEHDFGGVAKASLQKHIFEFENTLGTDLEVTGVRTSCGCTKPAVLTTLVKPGEKAQIEARFDTVAFSGHRGATVTVGLKKNQPYSEYAEVRFTVKGHIRTDVVFDPGTVDFGSVVKGNKAERSVVLKYAGNPDWKIENIVPSNPGVQVEFKEILRDRQRGRTDYQVNLKLDTNAIQGTFNDLLTIQTSEGGTSRLTFPVSGSVESMITVSDLQMGMVEKGRSMEKKLVVAGKEPFEILSVQCADPRIEFPSQTSGGAKTLHIINLKFNAMTEGLVNNEITIKTNSAVQPEVKINFGAQVIPATLASDPGK